MKKPYQKTMYACFIGYIVQAIVNNFVPLLFVTFQTDYRMPLQKITLLITVNFLIQLCVDLLSAGFIDRIGYRASVLLAHGFAAAGCGYFAGSGGVRAGRRAVGGAGQPHFGGLPNG